uniref:Uncharacterized protein n=1 Tax=Parascaris equorum TaxID=6256 RepID=A0A914S5M2_PAREQ
MNIVNTRCNRRIDIHWFLVGLYRRSVFIRLFGYYLRRLLRRKVHSPRHFLTTFDEQFSDFLTKSPLFFVA